MMKIDSHKKYVVFLQGFFIFLSLIIATVICSYFFIDIFELFLRETFRPEYKKAITSALWYGIPLLGFFYLCAWIKMPLVRHASVSLKDSLSSPVAIRRGGLCLLAFLFLIILSTFLREAYFVMGNLHDFWIPYLGAYALQQGMTLHEDFHTPFGFIYNGLNYVSLQIIDAFAIFHRTDMIMLSSLLFAILVTGLFYLTRVNTFKKTSIPWIVLFVILSMIPQVRFLSEMFNTRSGHAWYGIYNHHLFGLLLLQIAFMFCWHHFVVKAKQDILSIENRDIWLFSMIHALIAYIMFHYKFNFFISSSMVMASIIFILPFRLGLQYILKTVSLFLGFVLVTFILFQYSYLGYFKDIYHAILSRAPPYLDLNYFFMYIACLLFVRIFFPLTLQFDFKESSVSLKKYIGHYFSHIKYFVSTSKWNIFQGLLFDVCIGLAIFMGVEGDTFRPTQYYLVIALFYIIIHIPFIPYISSGIKRASYLVLTVLIMCLVFSLVRVTIFKFYEPHPSSWFTHYTVKTKHEDYPFLLFNHEKIEAVFEKLKTHRPDIVDSTLYIHHPKIIIYGNNVSYLGLLNDLFAFQNEIEMNTDDKFLLLAFSNPLPIFFNTPLIPRGWHWYDLHITFSHKTIHHFNEVFEQADFVSLPFFFEFDPLILKCYFYDWNFENKRFVLFARRSSGLLFATNEKLSEYNLQNFAEPLNEDKIRRTCSTLNSTWMSWQNHRRDNIANKVLQKLSNMIEQ